MIVERCASATWEGGSENSVHNCQLEEPARIASVRPDRIDRLLELSQESCLTCPSGFRIKIFTCAVHSECQLGDRVAALKFCGTCANFAKAPACALQIPENSAFGNA